MRDYTYIDGVRFSINNIFRSKRFDLDRLDVNWVDAPMPNFVRGYRIVDHQEFNTLTVHGVEADQIAFSMAYISYQVEGEGSDKFDNYLEIAMNHKKYLYNIDLEIKPQSEEVLH